MLITIYTPTYNRKETLPRLFKSLCKQSNKDFIWLIIDDGSTDETVELVNSWKNDALFEIKYIYKKNGGVHTARELAYEIAETELVWGVDSDDWLMDDAVELVKKLWNNNDTKLFLGIIAPEYNVNKKNKTINFPEIKSVSFQDLFYKYGACGDVDIIIRSDVVKKLKKFPIYPNERLVSESYKWIQLPDKPFLILNTCTKNIEYLENGYSNNARLGYFKNLNGYCDLYNIHIKHAKYLKNKFEYCLKYLITSFFLKKGNVIKNSTNRILSILCYPFAFLVFLFLKLKWKKYK